MTILSSQNQAEPDIKEFRTTFSESGLKNLIFFTPEQVDTALYLTRAGWELSEVDYEKLSHEMDQMKKTQEKIDSDPEIKTRLSFIKSLGIPRFTNIDSLVIDSNFFNVFGKVQEYFSNNRERLSLLFKVSEKGRLSVDYQVLARFGNQIIKEGSFLTDDDRRFWQYLNLLSQHNCFEDDFFGQFAIKEKSLIVRHFDGETVDEQLPLLMKDGLEKYLSDHDCKVNSGELKSKVTDLYLSKMIPDAYKDLAKAYSSLIQRFTNDYYKRSYGEIFYEGMEDWEKMTKNGRLTPEFFYMFFDTKIMSISNNFWINELLDKGLITTFPESVRPFFTLYESNYYLRSLLVGHRKFFIETESGRQNFALLGQVGQTFRSIPSTVRDDIIENFFGKYLKRLVEEKPVSLEEEKEMILTLSLVEKAYKTPSGEFKRILGVVLPLIMQSPDPEKAFDSIESAYIHNRLPHVIKEFLVFKTIYSQTDDEGSSLFQKTLDKNIKDGTVNLSPTLKAASDEKRFEVIYRYLAGNAVRSNDTNLRQYLEVFKDVDRTLGIIDRHGAANATAYESDITRFLDRAEKLFFFVTPDKSSPATSLSNLPIEQRLENIARIVGAVSYHEIPGKISRLFLSPLGFGSIDEMLKAMDNHSKEATERNIAFAQKIMSGGEIFSPGDLLKSSQSQIGRNIFQTGLKCAEVLGGSFDSSNNTPFDADFSRVLETDIGQNIDQVLDSAVIRTAMTETNDIVLLVKDRGNLVDTSEGKALPEDFSSYETFWSRYADIQYGKKGESEHRHYGVTVGVASTDINAVILTDNFFNDKNSQIKLNRLFFDIASGSCYIPVLNKDGKVVFTPEQYEDYKINGGKMRLAIKNIENFNKPSLTLIDVLKENPLFNQLFGLSVQVGEGYTLEQHTEMVLNIFDRYYRDRFMALNISREEFALMLALHDIGKPISDKTSKQHYFTRPIIEDIAKQLDISAVKKELIVEIASQDILGEYLKGEIDESDAKKEIDYIAGKTGITPVEIFWLCQYYWQCDVASYTSEADPALKEGRFDKDINFDRERKRLSINNPEWIKRLENLKKTFV